MVENENWLLIFYFVITSVTSKDKRAALNFVRLSSIRKFPLRTDREGGGNEQREQGLAGCFWPLDLPYKKNRSRSPIPERLLSFIMFTFFCVSWQDQSLYLTLTVSPIQQGTVMEEPSAILRIKPSSLVGR